MIMKTLDSTRHRVGIEVVRSGKKGVKLSAGNVIVIRKMLAIKLRRNEIARSFGVCVGTIGHIQTGHCWGWLNGGGSDD